MSRPMRNTQKRHSLPTTLPARQESRAEKPREGCQLPHLEPHSHVSRTQAPALVCVYSTPQPLRQTLFSRYRAFLYFLLRFLVFAISKPKP